MARVLLYATWRGLSASSGCRGTYALTKRTTYRKAFLAPWHPLVMQIWLWVLAGGQRLYNIGIHHTSLNVSHQHSTVTTQDEANLPEFTEYMHREMSKALNVLLAELRYEQPADFAESEHAFRDIVIAGFTPT